MKKILLIQLPLPVEQALAEHLKDAASFAVVCLKKHAGDLSRHDPDLVVTGAAEKVASLPGCPVLPLSFARPQRLGQLLRQIGQMLAEPVLYMDDIMIGPCIFKPQEKLMVRGEGEEIALTDREVDLLAYLVRRRQGPVSRDELLKNVWQYQEGVDTHTLETHIYRLRQKIELNADAPRLLLTLEGGYSLHLPETAV